MTWATIATILAVMFKHFYQEFKAKCRQIELALLLVAENKAEIFTEGDKVKVRMI